MMWTEVYLVNDLILKPGVRNDTADEKWTNCEMVEGGRSLPLTNKREQREALDDGETWRETLRPFIFAPSPRVTSRRIMATELRLLQNSQDPRFLSTGVQSPPQPEIHDQSPRSFSPGWRCPLWELSPLEESDSVPCVLCSYEHFAPSII